MKKNGQFKNTRKGILLAGGYGSRFYPATRSISKQLLPVYDKPMIYYPLSTLLNAGIRDILVVSTPYDVPRFEQLLGDGSRIGCTISYAMQEEPRGLADAFMVGETFIGSESVCLILGDNIFYGSAMGTKLQQYTNPTGGIVFGYQVADPRSYGVVEFDENMRAISIEEKPQHPKSNHAIPGLYFFDNQVVSIAKTVQPSARGELEITEILKAYMQKGQLAVCHLGRGTAWLDTGTFASMNQASLFVQVIEERQGVKIGCIEEIAYELGYITRDQLEQIAQPLIKSGYGEYLLRVARQ